MSIQEILEWASALNKELSSEYDRTLFNKIYHRAWDFIHSPRRKLMKKVGWGFHRLKDNGKWEYIEGLTKPLSSVFFPLKISHPSGGAETGGSERGREIDNDLERIINKRDLSGSFHPYTIRILKYLHGKKLRPFASQVLVSNVDLDIGTTLDILCVDKDGKIVNLQVKSGFDKNYDKPDGKMLSPFFSYKELTEIDDSFANRHRFQVIVENFLAIEAHHSEILLVTDTEIKQIIIRKDEDLETMILNELKRRNETPKVKNFVKAIQARFAKQTAIDKNKRKRNITK